MSYIVFILFYRKTLLDDLRRERVRLLLWLYHKCFGEASRTQFTQNAMVGCLCLFVIGVSSQVLADDPIFSSEDSYKPVSILPKDLGYTEEKKTDKSFDIAQVFKYFPGSGSDTVIHQGPGYQNQELLKSAPTKKLPGKSDEYVPVVSPNYVEAGINSYHVTNNQGSWFGQFVGAQYQSDPWNRWNAQIQQQKAFHENGFNFVAGNTHIFDQDWYSDVSFSTSTDTFFFPKYRADLAINRKMLDDRNLIATVGTTLSRAQETYKQIDLFGGITYYFPSPWILQAGGRIGVSDPGSVTAGSGFGALTYGFNGDYYLTGKYTLAYEAYQLLGPGNVVNSFTSHDFMVVYRKWLGDDWGINVTGELYSNPAYRRIGGSTSLFLEF